MTEQTQLVQARRADLVHAFDAAFPPQKAPAGHKAVFGYIGGNTPHVWTLAEWLRFQHLYQFPIWTGYHESHPVQMAKDAVSAALSLGWLRHPRHPRVIFNDFETEIDPEWSNAFADQVKSEGFITATYGSLSFVLKNKRHNGYFWTAEFNGLAELPDSISPGSVVIADQYLGNVTWENTEIDLNVVDEKFLRHAGTGPRHH